VRDLFPEDLFQGSSGVSCQLLVDAEPLDRGGREFIFEVTEYPFADRE